MIPKNFDWPYDQPGKMRLGMQRQKFVRIIDNETLRGTKISKGLILMSVGWISDVHTHDGTEVYIDVIECGDQGVLTLAGKQLEHAVWTGRYQSLYLPPRVPHVAIYPAPVGQLPDDTTSPDLLALETRMNSVFDADIRELPGYGGLLTQRLTELDLMSRVEPTPAMLGREVVAGSSCFPPHPGR